METLRIEPTDDSPKIMLDPKTGRGEISGKSLPEDVVAFYQPVIDWIRAYAPEAPPQSEIVFRLVYFNTASSKQLLDVMIALEKLAEAGKKVLIKWYSIEDDEEMQEAGHEYAEMVSIPFEHYTYIP
ncbi:MAG: DUF1987 domain-containing protein [Bacteroidota bacterium]